MNLYLEEFKKECINLLGKESFEKNEIKLEKLECKEYARFIELIKFGFSIEESFDILPKLDSLLDNSSLSVFDVIRVLADFKRKNEINSFFYSLNIDKMIEASHIINKEQMDDFKKPKINQIITFTEKIKKALNPLYQNKEDNFPIPKSKYHK